MGKHIPENEYDAVWLKCWQATKREFFKCEARDRYTEPGEEEFLDLYRNGDLEALREALREDTFSEESIWREASKRGVRFERVHVVSVPLSEYVRFELEAYRIQEEAGEIIRLVRRESIPAEKRAILVDFMLFDGETALVANYNDQDELIGGELLTDAVELNPLIRLRELLEEKGSSLSAFAGRYLAQ